MNMSTYISEFEKRYNKSKSEGFELSTGPLAYFLLNQARISDDHNKLIRATLTKMDFEQMSQKLKKVFGSYSTQSTDSNIDVKLEDVNLAEEDVLYGSYNNNNFREGGASYRQFSTSLLSLSKISKTILSYWDFRTFLSEIFDT